MLLFFLQAYCFEGYSLYSEKMAETVFPEYDWRSISHRKPDIVMVNKERKDCIIVEVTVPYNLYFTYAKNGKITRYTPYCTFVESKQYTTKLIVLCLGSLGIIDSEARLGLLYFKPHADKLKELLQFP